MNDNLPQIEPTAPSLTTYFQWFFWSSLAVFLFMYGTRPIIDPDFWWHLKTGAVMIENGGLLQSDPFTFTGDGVVSDREALILKGYWLWQITAYGLYALFSFNGIFFLNILTIGATASVLIWQLRRRQVPPALSAFLLSIGLFLVSATYPLERPQVISLLFIALLMALLNEVREGGQLGWTLPLLMMIWPQLHGGYVVGVLILLCFAAGVVIEYRQDLPRMRHLLFWVTLGILATFLNPNGAVVYVELFSFYNSGLMEGVSEFKSTWEKFQMGSHWVAALWGLIAIYFIGLGYSRRLYWPDLIVGLFLAYFSVKHARNIGFFPVAMLPLIGAHYLEGARRREWRLPSFLSPLVLTLGAVFFLWLSYSYWYVRQGSGPVKAIYPEKAIEFLHDSKLQGNMYNDYTYGGYMLWRLSPQIKIFIDGRGLEPQVFADWQKLSVASTNWVLGRREYEVLLEHYGIDYVIQPIYDGEGNLQLLMKSLLLKPEWVPIYLDSTVYILARANVKNAAAIDAYRIDKEEFKTRLLLIINYISQSAPQEIGYQVARAGMLLYMGMYDEAKAQVEVIAARSPKERSLSYLQNELSILRTKRMIESGSR